MATGRVIEVESRSEAGKVYRVELDDRGFVVECECKGYANRRRCWHTDRVNEQLSKRPAMRCSSCACLVGAPEPACACPVCEAMHGAPVMLASGEWVRRKARAATDRPDQPHAATAGDLYAGAPGERVSWFCPPRD